MNKQELKDLLNEYYFHYQHLAAKQWATVETLQEEGVNPRSKKYIDAKNMHDYYIGQEMAILQVLNDERVKG